MILFLALFILAILISAILAYLSMKDFRQSPQDFPFDNSLFLIRKPHSLTSDLLNSMHQMIEKNGLIISLERLFKGRESALLLYGPKNILANFAQNLDLLELEDYCGQKDRVLARDLGVKESTHVISSLFSDFPKLDTEEQVWYQMVLRAAGIASGDARQPKKGKSRQFKCQIRLVVISQDEARRKKLAGGLQAQKRGVIQSMDFYQKRSMGGETSLKLNCEDIVKLWSLPTS